MKLEDFLIQEEGDDSKRLPDGRYAATWDSIGKVWNIGPGLAHGVTKDTVWTAEQLKAAEDAEFAVTRAAVAKLVKVSLGENRTTALQSLCYNIGEAGFAHSTVLRRVNASDFDNVPAAFRMWDKAHGVVIRGLVNRRNDEIRLWNHPDSLPPPPDLKTSKNVPPASFFDLPQPKEPSMAAVSAPLPIATAGVNVSTTTVGTTFASVLTSFAVMVGGPIFSMIQGTTTSHYVAAGLFGLAGLGSLVSNIWGFVNHNSAASSNTLATISNLTQLAAQAANAIEPQTSS